MNGFIAHCSRYVFWFHIINQSGNDLLASQSEDATIAGCGQVVDILNDTNQHSTVAADNRLP